MSDFQRARRPEQVEVRRNSILAAAREMLSERPVAEVSLRELSSRVGLAKSNVLRYFDSREAVFLEVLDEQWRAWLDELEVDLDAAGPVDSKQYAAETMIARAVAASLGRRRLLCELISAMAGVLERNISVEFARSFKRRAMANGGRLAALVRTRLPHLTDAHAQHFADATFVVVAGLWPYATPTEAMATVMTEMGMTPTCEGFVDMLADGLTNQLIGLSVRAREAGVRQPAAPR